MPSLEYRVTNIHNAPHKLFLFRRTLRIILDYKTPSFLTLSHFIQTVTITDTSLKHLFKFISHHENAIVTFM